MRILWPGEWKTLSAREARGPGPSGKHHAAFWGTGPLGPRLGRFTFLSNFGPQNESQNGPKITPRELQNSSKKRLPTEKCEKLKFAPPPMDFNDL